MTDLAHDGNYKVTFVPGGVENKSAPKISELTSGIQLECRLTPTGLTREPTTEWKNSSKLCSTFATQTAGRRSFNLQVVAVREVGDTTGVEAALTYKALGDLIIRDDAGSGAYTEGDDVEVYPVQVGQPAKSAPAANEDQTITYGFGMTGDPQLNAVVASAA